MGVGEGEGEGEWVVRKPSRSDEVVEAEEQLRIASKIKDHFDSMAPKRPIKPNRSEPDSSSSFSTVSSLDEENVPEYHKFLSLKSQQSDPIFSEGSSSVQEEFVETPYYKDLISIDKQHHTTGSGFIRVGESFGDGYGLELNRGGRDHVRAGETVAFRSNPATNDWIPSTEEAGEANFVSSKPNRSENSLDG
ncbi:uncharacterized protein LOC122084538 [Macadamia integrifolia]|uniref:uncharacterized protein LOC122084538 n=1 Tax=Macadamia integrifolia TaxID=60698 RepID=UPI001C4F0D3B|nr:uncharacterized protein LOC122084538 [Macadamia integrifolia]